MPERARDLPIEPARRMLQDPPAGAPERPSERRGREPREGTREAPGGPPVDPPPDTNPAHGIDDRGAYAGRPDQGVKHTTGTGAGGATEWGGGGTNRHPSRVKSKPPGHGA